MHPLSGQGLLQPGLAVRARRKPDFSLSTVNIVLLLVLFFLIVGAPADQAERQIDLPVTRDLPLDALPRPLLLVEQGTGALILDGQEVSQPALQQAIAAGEIGGANGGANGRRLHLMVARDYPAQALLDLTTLLTQVGADVVLVTLRQSPDSGSSGGVP